MDSVTEALKQARYGEAVVVNVAEDASHNAREIILVATLDEEQGGICWKDVAMLSSSCEDSKDELYDDIGIARHLRTKRWVLPMLNDKRRNELYDTAIEAACHDSVLRRHGVPGPLHILDIGSGTGLLGMMAATHSSAAICKDVAGEQTSPPMNVKVTSLEMASAMARLAKKTIAANQLRTSIDVIAGHSCETTLEIKAHVCISELLESGLLGEGLLPALRDAWNRSLHSDAVIVPKGARVFCQVLEGKECVSRYRGPNSTPRIISLAVAADGVEVLLGGSGESPPGEGIVVPVHAEALFRSSPLEDTDGYHEARVLTEPTLVVDFDFSRDKIPDANGRCCSTTLVPIASGTAHGVLFWWELDLWNDVMYSTEPGKEPWQDHWLQCLFVFPGDHESCRELKQGEPFELTTAHTDYRLSFSIRAENQQHQSPRKRRRQDREQEMGRGTFNRFVTPERAMQLNDEKRIALLQQATAAALAIKGASAPVLDLSDFSLCAILAAVQGAERVSSLESSSGGVPLLSARVAQLGNDLPKPEKEFQIVQSHAENLTLDVLYGDQIQIVVAEPYYELLEGWHLQEALNYFYLLRALRKRDVIASGAISVPSYAAVVGCAIQFDSFSRAYKACGDEKGSPMVRGFCHDIVNQYGDRYHLYDASLPLWQYDFKRLTDTFELAKISYEGSCEIEENSVQKSAPFKAFGTCHALMCWVDYGLQVSHMIEDGSSDDFSVLSTCTRSHRQIVRRLREPVTILEDDIGKAFFQCTATFGGLDNQEDHSFELGVQVGN